MCATISLLFTPYPSNETSSTLMFDILLFVLLSVLIFGLLDGLVFFVSPSLLIASRKASSALQHSAHSSSRCFQV